MVTSLPPVNGKPSTLVKDKQTAAAPTVVFLGAPKQSAELQFAGARAKLAKGETIILDGGTGTDTASSPASFTQVRGSGSSVSDTSTSMPLRRSHRRSSADRGCASAARRG